jgi:hypothetical protein
MWIYLFEFAFYNSLTFHCPVLRQDDLNQQRKRSPEIQKILIVGLPEIVVSI